MVVLKIYIMFCIFSEIGTITADINLLLIYIRLDNYKIQIL